MSNQIHIGVGLDESYQKHTCVMLKSAFDHTDPSQVQVHAIADETAKLERLRNLCDDHNAGFSQYTVNPSDFQNVHGRTDWSTAIYYRILLPRKIPNNVNTLLYFDSDMVILDDVLNIYERDMDAIAKVCVEKADINILDKTINDYFNSGVMLINCYRWRTNNLTKEAMTLAQRHGGKFHYPDQDVLNYLIDTDKAELATEWNVRKTLYRKNKSILNDAKIIHYTGPLKPWHKLCLHPRRDIYRQYAERLGFEPVDPNPFAGLHPSLFPEYPKYALRLVLEKLGLYKHLRS